MCNRNCNKLCPNLIFSSSVTVTGTNLVINIPAIKSKFCMVLVQNIPDAATVNMPVVVTIGTATTEYQVVDNCGIPVTASAINTRTRYPVCLYSSNGVAILKILRNLMPVCSNIDLTIAGPTGGE